MSDPLHAVSLTDEELLLLDGRVAEKPQAEVDAAKRRIAARSEGLTIRQSDLIAAVVAHALKEGTLRWTSKPIASCQICGRDDGYRKFKSGQRKGQNDYKHRKTFQGRDLDTSFVTVQHRAFLGGCTDCMDALVPHLRAALADIAVDAPASLLGDDHPAFTKRRNRKCKKCGWQGHEGEMTQDRTLMGDGWFPSRCPECGTGGAFNRDVEHVDGFVLVPADAP